MSIGGLSEARLGRLHDVMAGYVERGEIPGIAGYWIWQVRSMDEAVELLKRAPFDGGEEVEIRPVFDPEDFAASDPTGELREAEAKMAAQMAENAKR